MSNWSCDILANMIKTRVKDDKNFMGITIGQTGSGKSLTTSRILGAIDESFYDECRVVFTPQEYLEQIKSMDKYEAVMFDEAGVGISHREWMHAQNKLIGMTTQLFRHLNLVTVFTVPHIDFIDVMERKLLHGVIEMIEHDKEKGFSLSKYYIVKTDALTGSVSNKLAKYGNNQLLDPIVTPLPPDTFIKKYVKMKEDYAHNFYKETLQTLKEGDAGKPDRRTIDMYKRKEDCLFKTIDYLKKEKTWKEIEGITGISGRTLREWMGTVTNET